MIKTIEEEIQQKKFRNEFHKVQLNLLFSAGWLSIHQGRVFKKFDMSLQQYNILRILKGSLPTPCSLNTIKSRMLDRMSDTSRIIDRLYKNGFIERVVNDKDRRSVNITISEKGLQLIENMESQIQEMDNLSSALSLEEANQLNTLLDKLRSYNNL